MISEHRLINIHIVILSDVYERGKEKKRKKQKETERERGEGERERERERERETMTTTNDHISRPRGSSFCVLQCEKIIIARSMARSDPAALFSATMASNLWDRTLILFFSFLFDRVY